MSTNPGCLQKLCGNVNITFVERKQPRYIIGFFLKNGPSSASFSFIFGLFLTSINTILQQNNVKTCPSSEQESPPITTRPS